MSLSNRIVSYLQNPNISFYIFLAGFIAFRSLFLFVLMGMALFILLRDEEDVRLTNNDNEVDILSTVGVLLFFALFIPLLSMLFLSFLPATILGKIASFWAHLSLLPSNFDLAILGYFENREDIGALAVYIEKLTFDDAKVMAVAYLSAISGLVISAFMMSVIFLDIHEFGQKLTKAFPGSFPVIFCLFLMVFGLVAVVISSPLLLETRGLGNHTWNYLAKNVLGRTIIWLFYCLCFISFLKLFFLLNEVEKP